jgi:hypothetical protein
MNLNWERIWRGGGIAFAVLFIISYFIYDDQPEVGASADSLVSFYDGDRGRILTAMVIFGVGLLSLLWFAAAIATTLRDARQGVWGAAATAASAAMGAVLFVITAVDAALAFSIAGSGNDALTSGLNDLSWVLGVMVSFPVAMLIMAVTFGLRQAGIIPSGFFWAGVLAIIVVLLRGTTWAADGFWSPSGFYSQYVAPIVALVWVTAVSGFLYVRSSSTGASTPERAVKPAR